jgi:hypothetical protein
MSALYWRIPASVLGLCGTNTVLSSICALVSGVHGGNVPLVPLYAEGPLCGVINGPTLNVGCAVTGGNVTVDMLGLNICGIERYAMGTACCTGIDICANCCDRSSGEGEFWVSSFAISAS